MDYKSTLNLPKTDFPMKADLPKREPLLLERWKHLDIYRMILEKSKDKPKFVLHDGPPYANGDIHIGHALNKILKDIIIKYKTMRGYNSAYVPGWDCHGLPVEHQLFKELGINKYQINQVEFRKKAYDYALSFVNKQKEQFIRLGVFGDWQNPYLTLAAGYEESILNSLSQLVKKGYVYRGLKPVNWCFKCETALAEAEVEYENHVSPSVFVKFAVDRSDFRFNSAGRRAESSIDGATEFTLRKVEGLTIDTKRSRSAENQAYLLIWTTTPWTLIANVAVSAHPDFIYSFIKTEKGNLILAKDLLSDVLSLAGITRYDLIREFTGKELEGMVYTHPFGLRKGCVVLADYVSKKEGSGLVHTAPGHGMEDYLTGLKYKLGIIMPVDKRGNFDNSVPDELKGLNVYDANGIILEKLQNTGILFWQGQIQHSYPHCWRCKKPVIFRATKQWFLKIDHLDLRKKLLDAINKDIKWIPESGKERIAAMVELRPDWCLSRQRYWGVPMPALVCEKCSEEILNPEVIEKFGAFTAKEGSDCWFKRGIKDFLPENLRCPNCGNNTFSKGADILDVWFDSGASHQAVLKKREELKFPCDLYLEGSDQHRGWFQSSLIPSMCIDEKPPFKSVLTHGFVVDGEGKKMSKSLGNVISPFDIIKNSGVDILRLWVASSDYNDDIRISSVILSRLSENYRKIRNTARFILSNLYDFNPDTDKVDSQGLKMIDKWILFLLDRLAAVSVKNAYENFEFHKAYKAIYDFCNEELSMYYLDMIKGRLYTLAQNSKQRRAAQTALYEVLNVLLRLMTPMLVFSAEEIWQNMPKQAKYCSIPSVHLLDWPEDNGRFWENNANDIAHFDSNVIKLIPDVAKALEEKRSKGVIGSPFDSKIKLLTNNENRYKYLSGLNDELCEIFKVSQVEIKLTADTGPDAIKSQTYSDTAIEVSKAEGAKCERCWNYSFSVGNNLAHPLICNRCLSAISK